MRAQPSSDTTETEDALALLPLPDLDGLTDDQTRGATCVWCPVDSPPLTVETAIDLGEHMSLLSGSTSPMRWFPRSCRAHAAHAALKALHDHAPSCEQCTDDPACCEIGRVLRRVSLGRQP